MADFKELEGKRLIRIEGLEFNSEYVKFVCSDGKEYVMLHYQD